MLDCLKDGFGLALVAVGFVAGAIVHALIYIWRNSVPDDTPPSATAEQQSHVEAVPMVYVTFTIALLGIVSMVALTLGWLE